MSHSILTDTVASITDLKQNPMKTVASADGEPIAILNRNKAAFYCVPAEVYERMLERMDDLMLIETIQRREGQEEINMDFDDL